MTKVDSSRSVNAMNEKIWWVVRLMSGRVQARKLNIFYVRLSNQNRVLSHWPKRWMDMLPNDENHYLL
ncbi:hypothetical protein HZH66_013376 [Vespula vulgaris]|uniref:Uncharacterized protein n=1 Tax=Vespula vulgaris TaxID=7454 RepID=A0A834J727_VESVU|nr:hypothetical protein HZH66_013376 [Vespula vulgaris]